MKICTLLVIALELVSLTFCVNLEAFLPVWRALGWKRIILVAPQSINNHAISLLTRSSQVSISLTFIPSLGYLEFWEGPLAQQIKGNSTYVVFACHSRCDSRQEENVLHFLRLFELPLHMMVVTSSSLIIPDTSRQKIGKFLNSRVAQNISSHFFWSTTNTKGDAVLYRIQTFSHELGYVQDRWNLFGGAGETNSYYNNSFNMQGHTITNVALSWKPWLEVGMCTKGVSPINNEANKKCETSGVLKELMENLAYMYNFTWTVDQPQDGKWGTIPKTSKSQTISPSDYFGALGNLVRKEYDMALSVWGSTPERQEIMDFTTAIAQVPKVIIINQNRHPWDLTLFIRVFTVQSWMATLVCLSILLPALSFIHRSKVAKRAHLSKRIAVLASWLLFILLSSYYSGALTMFFSSIPSIPFQTIQEGLEKHWEMVLQNGMHLYPMQQAQPGSKCKACQDWAERHRKSPGTLIIDNFDEMLDKLSHGNKVFTFAEIPTFINNFKQKPRPGIIPQQIGKVIPHAAHMVLWKNSPLLPMMNQGILRMWQRGNLDILTKRFDTYIPSKEELATKAVRADHVVLVFSSFVICILVIMIILLGEILHWKYFQARSLSLKELMQFSWK